LGFFTFVLPDTYNVQGNPLIVSKLLRIGYRFIRCIFPSGKASLKSPKTNMQGSVI